MSNQSPYVPPTAALSNAGAKGAVDICAKRPLSVWIALIFLSIFSIFAIPIAFYGFYRSFLFVSANFDSNPLRLAGEFLLWLAVYVIGLSAPVLAIKGIIQRTKMGRWAGVVSLVLLLVLAVVGHYAQTQGPIHRFEYSNDAQRAGGDAANVLLSIGYAILVFRFGFSKKSKNYFDS